MLPSPPPAPTPAVLFEHLPDAVYLLDPDSSHIVWCNRAGWDSLGLTPEAVLDHSVLSLQKDVTGLPQWGEIAAVIRRQRDYTFVGRHRHAQGHELAVEVYTRCFEHEGREYFLSVARDITRRVALEADLNRREKQLWFALNEAADGLWDWNVPAGEVFFSPQLKRMLGYGPDEMAPTLASWSANVHPDDAERVMQQLDDHLQGRRTRYEAEYRLRNRNGVYLWVHDQGRVCERDAEGRATRVVGMVQDVTARHDAQDALARHRAQLEQQVLQRTAALNEAKTAAEAANRAKSRFLATMSHELRTPLTAIIGLGGLALQDAADPLLRERLERIGQASQHLLGLIDDILDLSKIEAERMVLEQAPFQLGPLVDTVSSLVGHRATERGLGFRIVLEPTLATATLRGDALRLKQILLNLLDNAVKFTPQGEVSLAVAPAPAPGGQRGLVFEVRDSGIGIEAGDIERMFHPFEQADSSTTRRYGGSGLGLAICRRLVQMMGGRIEVDSHPGEGTLFRVRLALPEATSPEAQAGTTDPGTLREWLRQRHAGQRVLLVDDDPVGRQVAATLLRMAGLQVDEAGDGEGAVRCAAECAYALVLMDMQMPRMGGIEAVQALRRGGASQATPVLGLTANAFADDRRRCLEAGMDDVVTKPVDAALLYRAVLQQLQQTARLAAL